MPDFNIISLFSGGGGLDLGFHQCGFNSIICTDSDPIACQTLRENELATDILEKDIHEISNQEFQSVAQKSQKNIDVIIGGPPCPAFSKSRFYRKEMAHGIDDPSFSTVVEYFRVIECFKPKFFLFENVHTFVAARQKGALLYVLEQCEKLGYKPDYTILNAADFGVPQKRQRFFLIGYSKEFDFSFPEPTHRNPNSKTLFNLNLPPWKTAGLAISDLDDPDNDHSLKGHFAGGKDHHLLHEIPAGENYLFFTEERGHPEPLFKWRSRYWSFLLKLSPELPSWTIQARRSNNMGPLHWRNRILTIPEVKRLQTFPDEFDFSGTIEQQWRQIGNAVPPILAKHIAKRILISLEGRQSCGKKAA